MAKTVPLIFCDFCDNEEEFLRIPKAAAVANVSEKTIYRYIEAGSIFAIKVAGKNYRVCAGLSAPADSSRRERRRREKPPGPAGRFAMRSNKLLIALVAATLEHQSIFSTALLKRLCSPHPVNFVQMISAGVCFIRIRKYAGPTCPIAPNWLPQRAVSPRRRSRFLVR